MNKVRLLRTAAVAVLVILVLPSVGHADSVWVCDYDDYGRQVNCRWEESGEDDDGDGCEPFCYACLPSDCDSGYAKVCFDERCIRSDA